MSDPSQPVLELRDVDRTYGTGETATHALRGVDLRVDRSELVAIVGPSGSGKTTLLNIMGLLDRPTAGTVRLLGRATESMDDQARTEARGHSLGFVFQFHHLLPEFTAIENVMMPAWLTRGVADGQPRSRAAELLERVGLGTLVNRRVDQLSGGQQQRVAVARALALGAPLILADEPTGNLDTESSDAVFALLEEINRETGTSFVIVTHDPEIARRCRRRVRLVDGRVVEDTCDGSGSGSPRSSSE